MVCRVSYRGAMSNPAESSTHAPDPRPSDHPPIESGRVGVLLVNLGTPDATDAGSVRRYLREFLSDKRVIEVNSLVWKAVLYGIVLPFRPKRKGRDYDKIWNRDKDESPLKTVTRSQADKLGRMLAPLGEQLVVDWAMRYGNPSIASRLTALAAAGCERILLVPLYPQYCAATTATVCDEAFRALMKMRWQPAIRVVPPYHDEPAYIEAVAASLTTELARLSYSPEVILASFHGIPKQYFLDGDPYYCHCAKTVRLLRERLDLDDKKLVMTFQSRFGRAEWLQPYTDKTVERLAREGVKRIAVLTPGFSADCLETLEEIAGENAEIFRHSGGADFVHVPCLNDGEPGMRVIEAIVLRELQGWLQGGM
jgi:protoporphyrin/coproporphyrin ferrochelatase